MTPTQSEPATPGGSRAMTDTERRALNVRVAETVMGWTLFDNLGAAGGRLWRGHGGGFGDYHEGEEPDFAGEVGLAMTVVAEVQRKHPGWRFSLLGGDVTMGYKADREGNLLCDPVHGLVVAEDSRFAFGWHAEFFGDVDPRKSTGGRHGEAEADTAAEAICLAALDAYAKAGTP